MREKEKGVANDGDGNDTDPFEDVEAVISAQLGENTNSHVRWPILSAFCHRHHSSICIWIAHGANLDPR